MKKIFLIVAFISLIFNGFSQQSYYNDVDLDLTGSELKNALSTKITQTHTKFLQYTPDVWIASKVTDANPNNTDEVILIYGWEAGNDQDDRNDRTRSNTLQDNGSNGSFVWNREHVYPQSLGTPDITTSTIPGQDAHSLRPVDKPTNSSRGNKRFAEGSGNSGVSNDGWYPGDEWKGDVARMMMYMYVRYDDQCLPTNVGIGDSSLTQDAMIDLFLKWNVDDPVSAIEIARNEYHENRNNSAAQGNRNPFIDNPYLATRIWGGNSAEDRWDYYKNTDTEAPTTPTNVFLNNITFNSINISWSASSDNIGVTGYNVYIDDVLTSQTSSSITNTTISNLSTNTDYNFTIVAKDLINNRSDSAAINGKTLEDTEAPSIPTNLSISNETDSSVKVSWTPSTDNNVVNGYEVYVDNDLKETTTNSFYTVNGLNTTTTYTIEIVAYDIDNNKSAKSNSINATTTAGTSNGITELFISEYAEPSIANNKAIEIVNLTASTINLSEYSIQKQYNGGSWIDDYPLGNANIVPGDVFVIVHVDTNNSLLLAEADKFGPPNIDTSPYGYGSPLNFNGNDPIGLFKNGVLIDIIGEEGNSSNHIQNKTYRRKATVSEPNTRFDSSEWDLLDADTFDDFGSHTSTLSTNTISFESFKMFPNPVNGDKIYFNTSVDSRVSIYTVLGKLVQSSKVTKTKNSIDISQFAKGIYLVKINSGKQFISKKLIKN